MGFSDPDGDIIVAAVIAGAAFGAIIQGNINAFSGGSMLGGWGQGAIVGAMAGLSAGTATGAILGVASGHLPSANVDLGGGIGLSLSPAVAFGTNGFSVGVNVGLGYKSGDFSAGIGAGVGYTSMSLRANSVSGVNGSLDGGFYGENSTFGNPYSLWLF